MSVKKEQEQKSNNKKPLMITLIALCVVIVALLSVIVGLLLGQQSAGGQQAADEPPKRNVVVTKDNVEDIVEDMKEATVAPGMYEVKMNSTWYFEDGSSPSRNAYVENVVNNTNDVYFDVVLAENEETVLLASPLIPRGSYMDEISLDVDLDPGTYDCVLIYHLVDENQNTLSTLRMAITIVVEG